MEDPSLSPADERTLRFLRILVLVLTATMIVGMVVLVVLFLTRFPGAKNAPTESRSGGFVLPETIAVPDGAHVQAVTQGEDWWAVVTDTEILIFDGASGVLRQKVEIER